MEDKYDEGVQANKEMRLLAVNDEHELLKTPHYATRFVFGEWIFSETKKYRRPIYNVPQCKRRIITRC